MQLKKMVPLALVAVITTTAVAGAANLPLEKKISPSDVYSYMCDSGFRQNLLDKYFAFLCGQFPGNRPEQKPEETPEETPDVEQPEETPDVEQPEETPDVEQPEETPDVEQPEETPDVEQPEETPDNPPQLPDDNRPEETPDNTPEQTPEEDNDASQGDYASQVVALVNAERAKYGLSALKVDSRVQQAAQVRAKETVQSFSHTRPNGSSFSTALTEAGVSYTRSGENIAYGQSTPQQVVQAWMNSSGHRANILNENFTTIGVGYTVSGGTAYWAQLFTA
ncbi:CAP domain-containing protein [uncultured Agathobaculum sp.]|uniref:CAP domain-containing protein n=1 Tax=uncultured Agathobaculum sp. TaxID=2048140 RepID=UPI00320A1DEB